MEILRLENVHKSFNRRAVIEGLSLTVAQNSVYGFVGKNGAGKTTTMKMILGLINADKGDIYVCGERVRPGSSKTNRYIGYLPDVPDFYGYMTPKEYMRLCGQVAGLPNEETTKNTSELLTLVGLDGVNRRIKGFSRGMRQRLGIAQALVTNPRLLLCDEPTSALDPAGRKEILDILSRIKTQTTIIFSTHILSDVERICDSVGVINNGKLVIEGAISEVKSRYHTDTVSLSVVGDNGVFCEKLKTLTTVSDAVINENKILVSTKDIGAAGKDIIRMIADSGESLKSYDILEPDLEHIFMEATV